MICGAYGAVNWPEGAPDLRPEQLGVRLSPPTNPHQLES